MMEIQFEGKIDPADVARKLRERLKGSQTRIWCTGEEG